MTSENSFSLRAKLALMIVLASSISLVQCKSLDTADRQDPLMAMPSEFSSHQAAAPYTQPQQVHYIVHQEPQTEPAYQQVAAAAASGDFNGPSGQPRQEVSYVLVKSGEGQPSAGNQQPDTPVEEDCNQRERGDYMVTPNLDQIAPGQILAEGRQDYPGEIVYVSQNGDSRPLNVHNNGQQEQESLASAVSQSSGMPATILTEIPIRDMPYEVLEKLRREYGVKVVATRERPGANLVINCDDYTGQGRSVCSRQAPTRTNNPYTALATVDEQDSSQNLQRESALIGQAGPYLMDDRYVTRDGQAGEMVAAQPDNQAYRVGFGSRTYVTLEQTEPAQLERRDQVDASIDTSVAVEEKSENQAQSDGGFEAQPDSEAEQTGKSSQ